MSATSVAEAKTTSIAPKYARLHRGGAYFTLPKRSSMAEFERDKKLLDSIPYATSFELAKARVLEIHAQRDREIASGVLEGEALGPQGTRKQTCLQDSFLSRYS